MGNIYIGDSNSKARKIKSAYVGVDNIAKKIKAVYIGDANGKARLVWQSVIEKVVTFVSSLCKGTYSFTHSFINYQSSTSIDYRYPQKIGENLYGGIYYESGYDTMNDYNYTATGLYCISLDNNCKPISIGKREIYSNSGTNISGTGGSVSVCTTIGDGKLYSLGLTYVSYGSYTEDIHYRFMYDYNTGYSCRSRIMSERTDSEVTYYHGIARAGNSGAIYLKDYEKKTNRTGKFTLELDYNITIGNDTYSIGESGRITIPSTISKDYKSSQMYLYEINNTSGLIIESDDYSTTRRFIKYTINTSSNVTGSNRITLTELGTYKFTYEYDLCEKVNDNTFVIYDYNYHFMVITINDNNTISTGTETTLDSSMQGYRIVSRIGTTNTFVLYNSTHSKSKLIYIDTKNRTITYLGEKNVGTIDHSFGDWYLYYCVPYKDDSILYFRHECDKSYGYLKTVVDTYK